MLNTFNPDRLILISTVGPFNFRINFDPKNLIFFLGKQKIISFQINSVFEPGLGTFKLSFPVR